MKIWTSKYHLFGKGTINDQSPNGEYKLGSLLKIEFAEGEVGYADCCPFEGMGDDPLDTHLESLKSGRPTPLMKRSLYFAQKDALARKDNRALLGSGSNLKNHLLIPNISKIDFKNFDADYAHGYERIKVKLGRDLFVETEMLKEVAHRLKPGHLLRLDFNGRLNEKKFRSWYEGVAAELGDKIEFIEDPFSYDPKTWAQVAEDLNVTLALDLLADPLEVDTSGAQIIVVKPAIQDAEAILNDLQDQSKKFVITHYMDYPIGQICALHEAERLALTYGKDFLHCGLQARNLFEDSDFSRAIQFDGPSVIPPQGTGIGFDELLEDIRWDEL